jgi:hypothetical protein
MCQAVLFCFIKIHCVSSECCHATGENVRQYCFVSLKFTVYRASAAMLLVRMSGSIVLFH